VLDTTRKRKLQLFGHVCRIPEDRLLKTLMMGMVEGRQQPGRPHEGVLVIYWSGGQDVKCVVLLNENRDKCRKFVASLAYTV